jgi:hypothetical protein
MTAVSRKIRLSGKSLSCTTNTGGPFPWAKARPERDADNAAKVENKEDLYRLSSQAPLWRVAGQLW